MCQTSRSTCIKMQAPEFLHCSYTTYILQKGFLWCSALCCSLLNSFVYCNSGTILLLFLSLIVCEPSYPLCLWEVSMTPRKELRFNVCHFITFHAEVTCVWDKLSFRQRHLCHAQTLTCATLLRFIVDVAPMLKFLDCLFVWKPRIMVSLSKFNAVLLWLTLHKVSNIFIINCSVIGSFSVLVVSIVRWRHLKEQVSFYVQESLFVSLWFWWHRRCTAVLCK